MSSSSLTPNAVLPESIKKFAKLSFLHKTWANTFTCSPQYYFQPESIDEVIELVKTAKLFHKTLMTFGSGHSPSDMTMTKEWLVNLDKLDHILDVKHDKSGKFADVTVEAGIRIEQLNEQLREKELALQNLGSISDQSIAGLISTGTHGSTSFHAVVSQQIVDLTLVNGEGKLVRCSQDDNLELFRAALLSLGKIGIIVKATIRTVPKFQVKSLQQVITFDNLLNNWESIWVSSEYIRVWWFPYTGKCVVWRASKTDEPAITPKGGSKFWQSIGRFIHESLLYISTAIYPRLTPTVERFLFNKLYGSLEPFQLEGGVPNNKNNYLVQHSYEAFNMDCLFSQYVNEWAAPLNNGPEVLRLLNHSFLEAANKNDFYIHVPVEVRCSNNTVSGDLNNLNKNLDTRKAIDIGPVKGNNVTPFLDSSPKLNYVDSVSYLTSTVNESSNNSDAASSFFSSEVSDSLLKTKSSIPKLNTNANTILDTPITNITNSQLTLYINLVMYRPFGYSSPINKFFKIFEEIMTAAEGKPHWAKNFIGSTSYLPKGVEAKSSYGEHEMIGFSEKVKEWFGEDLKTWQKVRREQDPDDVFLSGKDWAVRNGIVDIDE